MPVHWSASLRAAAVQGSGPSFWSRSLYDQTRSLWIKNCINGKAKRRGGSTEDVDSGIEEPLLSRSYPSVPALLRPGALIGWARRYA